MQPTASTRFRRAALLPLAMLFLAAATTAGATSFLTPEASQLKGLDGWTSAPLFTVGETIDGYTPPGILDGLGAQKLDRHTVRIYANHELGNSVGYAYTLANGLQLTGARISTFDVNRSSRRICGAGLAYDKVYDRHGNPVASAAQINETGHLTRGFSRFCSSAFYARNTFGFASDIYVTGEENTNGTVWALDVASRALWACPALGRGAWENVCALDSGCKDRVALLLGDDEERSPLYLWIGIKSKQGGFLERNGLADGQLYVWAADNGDTTPEQFKGLGASRSGEFLPVNARDSSKAGLPGYDAQGYRNDATLRAAALALGAFSFSRPEDLHANPRCRTQAAFASTGRGSVYPSDNWGTIYVLDVEFARRHGCRSCDLPAGIPASIRILVNSDLLAVPDSGVRSPDNLVWSRDGFVYVQEDRSTTPGSLFGAASGREASIWQVDPWTGDATRIAEIDRTAVVPAAGGVTDASPTDVGNWESSGIVDVTDLFPRAKGERLLLCDVQAHSLRNGVIGGSTGLVEGGQLVLLSKRVSKNSGRDDDRCERDDD